MKSILDRYIDRVLVYANKLEPESEAIRQELKDHLLQKVEDLAAGGLSREEAVLEALRKHGSPKVIGYRLRGPFPWIDIRSHGTARGVIAIGPRAVGIFAFGAFAVGVFAIGGAAIGIFSVGAFAFGLLFAWACLGIGGLAYAAMAIGVVAAGAVAVGAVAVGGVAVGGWIPSRFHGSVNISHYTANNAPSFLKYLARLLDVAAFIDRYIGIILPAYTVALLVLFYLQYREGKRVRVHDDWLLDG